jgi:LysM repeat protein
MDGRRMVRLYAAPAGFLLALTITVLALHYTVQRHTPVHAAKAARIVRLPEPRRQASTIPVDRFVIVQHGDSFSAISSRTRIPVATLERLNPGISPTALHVGQKIRVH